MADVFRKRKIGEADLLEEKLNLSEPAFRKDLNFRQKDEQEFNKRKNETTPQEAIATLNFAIRKALAEGGDETAAVLSRIREEFLEAGADSIFEGMDQKKLRSAKPILRPRRLK